MNPFEALSATKNIQMQSVFKCCILIICLFGVSPPPFPLPRKYTELGIHHTTLQDVDEIDRQSSFSSLSTF